MMDLIAFVKLAPEYQVHYGKGPVEVVEYYSLSCPKCRKFFQVELPKVDLEKASITFHPTPADLLTLQAMVCLENLTEEEKPIFLEAVIKHEKVSGVVLQAAMEAFGKPLPDLDKFEFLEKTKAFENALSYLMQDDVITVLPTMEIDGQIAKQLPTAQFLNEQVLKRSS